jgi:hypothetical protein
LVSKEAAKDVIHRGAEDSCWPAGKQKQHGVMFQSLMTPWKSPLPLGRVNWEKMEWKEDRQEKTEKGQTKKEFTSELAIFQV